MNRTITAASTALVAAMLLAAPTAAAATDDTAPPTTEVFWAMPHEGTPDRVTWPQSHAPAGPADCGIWYQVDTYPTGEVPALIADGMLTNGEDHGVVISWRFVYGGDCAPEPVDVCLNLDGLQETIPEGLEAGPATEHGPTCVAADVPAPPVSEPAPVLVPAVPSVEAAPLPPTKAIEMLPVTGPTLSDQLIGYGLALVGLGGGLLAWRRKAARA